MKEPTEPDDLRPVQRDLRPLERQSEGDNEGFGFYLTTAIVLVLMLMGLVVYLFRGLPP